MADPDCSPRSFHAIAALLREATTVLDEPFHYDAIAATLNQAADALDAIAKLREQIDALESPAPPEWDEYHDGFDMACRSVIRLIDDIAIRPVVVEEGGVSHG